MSELDVKFGFGSMAYIPEVEAVPEKTEKVNDHTYIHTGSAGREAYSQVTFYLDCKFGPEDDRISNPISWTVRVPGKLKGDTPYAQVENEAARQIAPMLRAVADQVEKLVADAEASERTDYAE